MLANALALVQLVARPGGFDAQLEGSLRREVRQLLP